MNNLCVIMSSSVLWYHSDLGHQSETWVGIFNILCPQEQNIWDGKYVVQCMWCVVINIDATSLESVSFFLFSELPFTGAWWPGSPGTNTLLLALTIGVFTWNRSFTFMTWVTVKVVYRGEPAHTIRLFGLDDGLEEIEFELVTLETVVSRERDKLVWTSRVKHTCLSAVLISCKEWAGRRQVNETSNIFLQRRPNLEKVWVLDNKSLSKTETEFKSLHSRRSTELRLKT